jgi:hypothetical protein
MIRMGVFLLPLAVVLVSGGQASAQFNIGNLFSGVGQNTNSAFSNTQARPNQSLFTPNNVATPTQNTENRRVGGFQFLNTSNATKNLMSVFNMNTSSTQLMGNRVIGYSEFPKEKDLPNVNYLTKYFHYKKPKPGGTN